jgi:hypothetical protein
MCLCVANNSRSFAEMAAQIFITNDKVMIHPLFIRSMTCEIISKKILPGHAMGTNKIWFDVRTPLTTAWPPSLHDVVSCVRKSDFLFGTQVNVSGLVLAGSADFKNVLMEAERFDARLASKASCSLMHEWLWI